MADIRPFRGIRYNVERVGGLREVIGPPEDIPSTEHALELTRNRPYSSVRLEMRDPAAPTEFAESGRRFREWLRDGILFQDSAPALYMYEHEYAWGKERQRLRGFFAALSLTEPEAGVVLPHENILRQNLDLRVSLLRGIHANLSAVYTLVEDDGRIERTLSAVASRQPDDTGQDDEGGIHRVWRITDPAQQRVLQETIARFPLYIADGHHRYAAALVYRDAARARGDAEAAEFVLTYIACTSDPGVMILPIHRLIRELDAREWEAALARIELFFDVETVPIDDRAPEKHVRREVAGLATRNSMPTFLALPPEATRMLTLRLRDWESIQSFLPDGASALTRRLDATVLDTMIIRFALGIDSEALESRVEFSPDPEHVCDQLRCGTAGAAFFVRPLPLSSLLAVARAGDRMPQKSTYFYPKIPIGLVMRDLSAGLVECAR